MKFLCLFLAVFAIGSNAAVAPFITPCLWSDSTCILTSAKKVLPFLIEGIKDLDIPPVDPVIIKEAIADSGELKLKFEDLKVVGMSKAELLEIKRDNAKSTLSVVFETPVQVTGTYTAGGKLLLTDFEGHGNVLLKTDKVRFNLEANLNKFDKDGKTYYNIDGYDYKFDIIGGFDFELENLFNGDTKRAEPIMKVIRGNWRDLIPEIGSPVIKMIVDAEMVIIKKLIASVPINEIELPA